MTLSPGAWLIVAVLLIALLAALVAVAILWRRTRQVRAPAPAQPLDVAQLQKPMFKAAMAALYPRDADNRYDKPCVLVCGAAGCGKSDVLRGAGMEPVDAMPGKDSGWWRSSEGVAFALPAAAWEDHAGPWIDFLRLLDRHRGRRALDAVVWLIPLGALENGTADGERMYRKFVDIQDRLGLRLPVYVIVTGCDGADGFAPWAARLPDGARAEPLGWSNSSPLGAIWRAQDGELAVGRMLQRLRRLVSALSARRDLGPDAPAVFTLPERLGAALGRLPQALQEAMRQNAAMTPFDLRGIYLSGRSVAPAEAAGAAQGGDPFELAPPPPSLPAPVFCRELFAQRIFGEFGLATVVQRRLNAERRSQLVVLGGACVLAAIWLVALVPTYFSTREQFLAIRAPLQDIDRAVAEVSGDTSSHFDEGATIELLDKMDDVRDWSTPQAALPLSWASCCGGLRRDVDRALFTYYSKVLFKEIDGALAAKARTLATKSSAPADEGSALVGQPDQMSQYQALNLFLDETLAYEDQYRRFEVIATPNGGDWKTTVGLMQYLFGVTLHSATSGTSERFDKVLHESTYQMTNRNVARLSEAFREHLKALHHAFIASAFDDNRLRRLQRQLVKDVSDLQDSHADQQVLLSTLQQEIGEMHALLTQTNAVWMADASLVTSEPYRAIDAKIRKSTYLGEKIASDLAATARQSQARFHAEIGADSSGTYPIMAYAEGKQLSIDPDLDSLQHAVGQLLQHHFAQGMSGPPATPPDPEQALAWDVGQLTAARDMLVDLQAYEAAELVKAPVRYQPALRRLARSQAAALVDSGLSGAATPAACELPWRCANLGEAQPVLGEILAAMRKLDLGAPAERWERLLDRQALVLLRDLANVAENDNLYLPDPHAVNSWDGAPGSAIHAYGVQTSAELPDYLDRQHEIVADLALASKGPRAWLMQPGVNSPADAGRALAAWVRIDAEMAKHAAKSPNSSLRKLEQFVTEDVANLDSGNCIERLGQALPPNADLFQRRMARVAAAYRPRCIRLAEQVTNQVYRELADYYNERLLNRFPFAAAPDAPPAEPDDVAGLLHKLDAHAGPLRGALRQRKDSQSAAALAFVDRLAAVQPVLAALLADDPAGGPAALDLRQEFRINRVREKGADQIIQWEVLAGDALPPAAAGGIPGVAWRLGQPIDMSLRWARNSTLRPVASPARPGMHVSDGAVHWQYDDPWALLHLLRDHVAPQSDLAERDARVPVVLRFVVPTRGVDGTPAGDAIAYARLSVSLHGKPERIAVPPFPTGAAPLLRTDARLAAQAIR